MRALSLLRASLSGAALGVVAAILLAVVGPFALGARPYSVLSGSMEPAISTGDVVVVERTSSSQVALGDVVTFLDPAGSGRLITHRVRGVQRSARSVRFVTRGDANSEVERWSVPAGGTVGRVLYRIPYAGHLAGLVSSPAGRIGLVGIPALLLGLFALSRIWRPRERRGALAATSGKQTWILSGLALAGLCACSSAAYAAFHAAAANPSDAFRAGSVAIGDNDSAATMLSFGPSLAGASDSGCVKVTYTGSLAADVRLHAAMSGGLASYLDLKVTRGTDSSPSFDSCAGFTPDSRNYIGAGAGVVFDGALSSFPDSWAAGLDDPADPGGNEIWTSSETHSYKLQVSFPSGAAGAENATAAATFKWEAHNR